MLQPVDKGGHRRFGDRFKDQAEQPAGAGEIPFPQRMAGIVGQRGMKDPGDFRPGLEPAGQRRAPFPDAA